MSHLSENKGRQEEICADLIGPYTIERDKKSPPRLWCITIIDPATGWFKMKQIQNKEAIKIANIVDQTWLTWYPWPTIIHFDRGTKFMARICKNGKT